MALDTRHGCRYFDHDCNTEMSIRKIIDGIIDREGGYVNDPDDKGGETKFGITVSTARSYGYRGAMKELPRELAVTIYADWYVDRPGLRPVELISSELCEKLVDAGVNLGTSRPISFLQRWLNALNTEGRYEKLTVDGSFGPKSLSALRAYYLWRKSDGITVLLRGLNALQAIHYLGLVESDARQGKFLFGWMRTRIE